eukprot:scaffold1525_cov142-Cylindrotheca_fusiformis.AAC.23
MSAFLNFLFAIWATFVAVDPTVIAFSKHPPFKPSAIAYTRGTLASSLSVVRNTRLQYGKKKDENESAKYTKVEDGSPLGVAVVVLGGSLIVFGGDNFSEIPVWVVFVTASAAAGISRLVRSQRNN